jgi:GxxExxY protein
MDRETLDHTSRVIITMAIKVHSKLGPGLLESVYRTYLAHELRNAGQHVLAEQVVPVFYDELQLDDGYRLDLLVNDVVIVEVKAVASILPVHLAQLLSYLRLTDKRVGLLLNFNVPRLVQRLRRVVNRY